MLYLVVGSFEVQIGIFDTYQKAKHQIEKYVEEKRGPKQLYAIRQMDLHTLYQIYDESTYTIIPEINDHKDDNALPYQNVMFVELYNLEKCFFLVTDYSIHSSILDQAYREFSGKEFKLDFEILKINDDQ